MRRLSLKTCWKNSISVCVSGIPVIHQTESSGVRSRQPGMISAHIAAKVSI